MSHGLAEDFKGPHHVARFLVGQIVIEAYPVDEPDNRMARQDRAIQEVAIIALRRYRATASALTRSPI
jgi:hypothetical protein